MILVETPISQLTRKQLKTLAEARAHGVSIEANTQARGFARMVFAMQGWEWEDDDGSIE